MTVTVTAKPPSGWRVRECPTCKRRRHIWQLQPKREGWKLWTCSKGHTWETEILSFEKATALLKQTYSTRTVLGFISGDSVIYQTLRRR